jgi:DnaJ like chaperone protein
MSLWSRIADALSALAAGEGLTAVFEKLRLEPQNTVGFTIAVIALGAKMAKADGLVTRDEVSAFREVFTIPAHEEANAARVFNMARQDVAGFEDYAARIAAMFEGNSDVLSDLMEGLFHIAIADGEYHPQEHDFLQDVSEIFGLPPREFASLRERFAPGVHHDPYAVLGVSRDMSMDDIRTRFRQLVRDTHPDRMAARGVPEEAVKLAEARMSEFNAAWDEIKREHVL